MINGIGFLIILGCVFGSFIISGGNMDIVLHALPHEMMAIAGAAIGAFLVGNSMPVVKLAGKGIGRAFKGPRWTSELYRDLLTLLFALFTTFKKKGATGIEPHLDAPEESAIFSRYPKILADHHLIEFICDYAPIAATPPRAGKRPAAAPVGLLADPSSLHNREIRVVEVQPGHASAHGMALPALPVRPAAQQPRLRPGLAA